METRRQGLPLFTFIGMLVAIVVLVQLWLLSAAIDALLGGDSGVLGPAAVASLVLFVLNVGLLWHVLSFDERVRRVERVGAGRRRRSRSARRMVVAR